jgi:uncharacterized protein (TIGR02996 family)
MWEVVPKAMGGDDPRLGTALVKVLGGPWAVVDDGWNDIAKVLRKLLDVRTLEPLRAVAGKPRDYIKDEIPPIIARLEKSKPAPLSAADQALVKKLTAAIKDMPEPGTAGPSPAKLEKAKAKAKGGGEMTLDAAVELVAKDAEQAIGPLVEAWRENRHPALAALIQRASKRVQRPALPQKPAAAALTAWMSLEAAKDPADVEQLAAGLRVGLVKQIIERLEKLAEHPHDPRISDAALAIFDDQPFTSGGARPIYTAAQKVIEVMNDPRAVVRLEHIQKNRLPGKGADGGVGFGELFKAKVERLLEKAKKFPLIVELPPALVAKIEKTLPEKAGEEDRFLAAIYAKPDDDEPRQVYADWLQERGDVRGEFIALQLAQARGEGTPEGDKRVRALISASARVLAGTIMPAVDLRGLEFERGFPVFCNLSDKRSPIIDDIAEHPAWVTVKRYYAWTTAKKLHPKLIKHLDSLGAKSVPRR